MRKWLYLKEARKISYMLGCIGHYKNRLLCAQGNFSGIKFKIGNLKSIFKNQIRLLKLKYSLKKAWKLDMISESDYKKLEDKRQKIYKAKKYWDWESQ